MQIQASDEEHNPRRALCDADDNSIGLVSTRRCRRPEWMWAALRGDRLLARAAWWSRPGDDTPFLLDVLDIDDTLPDPGRLTIGVRLHRPRQHPMANAFQRAGYVNFEREVKMTWS